MFVNTLIAMVEDELLLSLGWPPFLTTSVSIGSTILLLLVFGEVTPKSLSLAYAEGISIRIAPVVWALRNGLYPLVLLVGSVQSSLFRFLGRREAPPLNHEEYNAYIGMAHSVGAFSDEEAELLEDAFSVSKSPIHRFMTSRIDVPYVHGDDDEVEAARVIRASRCHYLPIVGDGLDNVSGFLGTRAFFTLRPEERSGWSRDPRCLFPVLFVPGNVSVTQTMSLMKQNQAPVAMVLDEYGGAVGLVVLEHLYEILLGEIDDEHEAGDWQVRRIDASTLRLNGMFSISEFEEMFAVRLPQTSAATLGGLMLERLERLPESGDTVEIDGLLFKVLTMDRHRIAEIELRFGTHVAVKGGMP
jgi:putative hemolysin